MKQIFEGETRSILCAQARAAADDARERINLQCNPLAKMNFNFKKASEIGAISFL